MLSRYLATATSVLALALPFGASAAGGPHVTVTADDSGTLQVRASHVFDAPLPDVLDALLDFPHYGAQHPDIESANVLTRTDNRASVRFEMTDHPLAPKQWMVSMYRWAQRGNEVRVVHRQTSGTFKQNQGTYQLTVMPDGRTKLRYKASIALGFPAPAALVKGRVASGVKTFITKASLSVAQSARSTTRQASK